MPSPPHPLTAWLTTPLEHETLEFKTASKSYSQTSILKYCIAIANEGGGHLILGITDSAPRQIVGTQAFSTLKQLNNLKLKIATQLRIRVDIQEHHHPDGRVLIFQIPSRPIATPLHLDGRYLMRAGSSLLPMPPDRLKAIFAEDPETWFTRLATPPVDSARVIALLNTQTYFDLINRPYPTTRKAVLQHLQQETLIHPAPPNWHITNLGAILFAKDLTKISHALARKAPRFIHYEGTGKTQTRTERQETAGYAVCFDTLVAFIHDTAPLNRHIEKTIRIEQKMFPLQSLRELIANALIHQDFAITGTSVMLEMYTDRIEITNPGPPIIGVDRFIDRNRSRNKHLANLMRRLGFCEEKGSGIDKVIQEVEAHQLPAPDFKQDDFCTTAILFAQTQFADMSKHARIRACYQHCCLRHISNLPMTNATLRARFQLQKSQSAAVSHVIAHTRKQGLIKPTNHLNSSPRYTSYLPTWS